MTEDRLIVALDFGELETTVMSFATLVGDQLVFSSPVFMDESSLLKPLAIEALDHDQSFTQDILDLLDSESRMESMPKNRARVWKQEQARAPKPRDLYRSMGAAKK